MIVDISCHIRLPKCQLMNNRLITLAKKFPATKFIKIFSEEVTVVTPRITETKLLLAGYP